MDDRASELRQLQQRIRLLELENDALAERAEDSLLLGLIAEKINRTDDSAEIERLGLEQTCVLKDIPVALHGEWVGDEVVCRAAYSTQGRDPVPGQRWRFGAPLRERLRQGPRGLTGTDLQEVEWGGALWPAGRALHQAFVVPVSLSPSGAGLFLFLDDRPGSRLSGLHALLQRSAEMIAVRSENVRLMRDLRALNEALDQRVDERTRELRQADLLLEQQMWERARAEEALAFSVERFRQAFVDSPLGMVLIDLAGRFNDANREFCAFLGYAAEELRRMTVDDVTAPEDRHRNVEVFGARQEALRQPSSVEKRYRRKDGSVAWGKVSATTLRDSHGVPVLRLGMVEDISARKAAEYASRDSEDRYRTLFEMASDAIFLADAQTGVLLDANVQAQRMVGRSLAEIRRMHQTELHPAACRGEARDKLWRAVEQSAGGQEILIQPSQGGAFPVEVNASVFQDQQGRRLILGLFRDLRPRKRAEAELQQLQEQLSQAQKMESVGRLAGGVAHDFNNLLTAMLGNVEVALAEADAKTPALVSESLREIEAAGKRAADVTRQLLAFSRKQALHMCAVDLHDAIPEFGRMLKRFIGENIQVQFVLAPGMGRVRADATQIKQVLLNLALNARDSMPEGGRLTIATAPVRVGEAGQAGHPEIPPGGYAVITVSDTGCGMDEETRQRIFEPFFTTKRVGQGTGLGLATVYGIVRQHDGYIHCESRPGEGTVFRVYFPLIEEAEEPAPETKPDPPPTGGTEIILVVEDDDAVRTLTAKILRRLGYEVAEVANGAAALEWIAQSPHLDLLLTDVMMPQMSGRQLASEVRALRPGLGVVFVSGYPQVADSHPAAREPRTAFLHKPFTAQSIAEAVRRVLTEPVKPERSSGAPAG